MVLPMAKVCCLQQKKIKTGKLSGLNKRAKEILRNNKTEWGRGKPKQTQISLLCFSITTSVIIENPAW